MRLTAMGRHRQYLRLSFLLTLPTAHVQWMRSRRMSMRLGFSTLRRDCGCGGCRSVTNLFENQLVKRSRTGHTLSIRLDAVFAKRKCVESGGTTRRRSVIRMPFYVYSTAVAMRLTAMGRHRQYLRLSFLLTLPTAHVQWMRRFTFPARSGQP